MNKLAWTFTAFLLFVGVAIPMLIPEGSTAPSLGDWGDYIGGIAGTLALIWLIVGHFQNQAGIRESKEDLKTQLELTQDVAASLLRIASGAQVHAAGILTDAEPSFVFVAATEAGRRGYQYAKKPTAKIGHIELKNCGGSVNVLDVQSVAGAFKSRLEKSGLCGTGHILKIEVESSQPVKLSGPIELLVQFEDKLRRRGTVQISSASFNTNPTVNVQMGTTHLTQETEE